MLFVEIYAKNVKFGFLNPILGKLRVTHFRAGFSIDNSCNFSVFPIFDNVATILNRKSHPPAHRSLQKLELFVYQTVTSVQTVYLLITDEV